MKDAVFNRVLAYMKRERIGKFWIDRYCIDQNEGPQRETGLCAMDRVYSLSDYPVALLEMGITSQTDMDLPSQILNESFSQRFQQPAWWLDGPSRALADEAVELLARITSDAWYTRSWTFQENYRGGDSMTLLIPHAEELNRSGQTRQ